MCHLSLRPSFCSIDGVVDLDFVTVSVRHHLALDACHLMKQHHSISVQCQSYLKAFYLKTHTILLSFKPVQYGAEQDSGSHSSASRDLTILNLS